MSRDDHEDARLIRDHLDDPKVLCGELGLLNGRRGRSWTSQVKGVMVLCPWHDEHTPSCSVIRGKDGTVQACCHGCGATGDALDLVAAVAGLDIERDFQAVLREGAHVAGLRLFDGDWNRPPRPVRPPPPPEPQPLDDDTFHALASTLLELCPLQLEPDVCRYLNSRRLGKIALAAGWGALPGNGQALDALRGRLVAQFGEDTWIRSGLAVREGKRRGMWVWWTHRLLIPWRGPGIEGCVQTLQRRVLGTAPDGVGKYVFATGRPARWPYGVEELAVEDDPEVPIVFVEGAVDTIALRALCRDSGRPAQVIGVPGVAAWKGINANAWSELARDRIAAIGLDAEPGGKARENVESAVKDMQRDLGAAGAVRIDEWKPKGAHDWADVWMMRRARAA